MLGKIIASVGLCVLWATSALAAYPTKPVTIVVPFPGGQTGDMIARLVGDQLSKKLGQPFIVENKAGAGGTIGSNYVAHAKNDGYTLLLTSTGPFSIAPYLYTKLPYRPLKDFAPVVEIATTPQILVTGKDSGINSVADLIKTAKSSDISYASNGNGSTQHLTMEIFKKSVNVKMVHVPFKGSAAADTSVMSGLIPVSFDSLPALLPHIKSGKLKALAVADYERSAFLPDVKTFAELGYPKFTTMAFFALMAPEGSPDEVISVLNSTINEIMKTPEMKERFKSVALTPAKEKTARQFSDYLHQDAAKWEQAVKDAGARID